ncbi:hypothetical protein PV327_004789, partial [Microctonus hyperodae]
ATVRALLDCEDLLRVSCTPPILSRILELIDVKNSLLKHSPGGNLMNGMDKALVTAC